MNIPEFRKTSLTIMRLAEVVSLLELDAFIEFSETAVREASPLTDSGALVRLIVLAKALREVKIARAEQRKNIPAETNTMNSIAAATWLMDIQA